MILGFEASTHSYRTLDLTYRGFITAHGKAAAVVLKAVVKPMNKLCALVAYYPNVLLAPDAKIPPSLNVLCSLTAPKLRYPIITTACIADVEEGFAEDQAS